MGTADDEQQPGPARGTAAAGPGLLDPTALGELARLHGPGLYRFALSLVRDPDAADDLVQDTFVRALSRLDGFRGDSSPRTWLHRILHNLAIDRARRAGREVLVDEVEERWQDDAYTVDSEVVIVRAERRDELEDALIHLPFAYRAVILLHDVEGWRLAEIADSLGIGLPAAKQRLRRGRMALVTLLAAGADRRAALEGVPLSCWEARARVGEYLDDELALSERTRLERHLETCPTCPGLYTSLVGVRASLGSLRDPDTVVAPGLAARIERRLRGSDA
ncbi:MAG: sigma-70 family RNA polymerase sigma factor [Thermoleophilia bacterium]